MAPALRICSCILRIAICHKLHHSLYVYVLRTGFSQDSRLFWVFFFFLCTVLYCKRDFSRDFSLWGERRMGFQAVYFRWRIHLQNFGLFSFNSNVQKNQTTTSEQSINEKHKKELKFSEGNLLKEINNKLRTYFSNYGVLSSTFCLSLPLFIKQASLSLRPPSISSYGSCNTLCYFGG